MTDTQLLHTALASLLVGGGTYAGMRGIRNLTHGNKPFKAENELEVTLPSSRIPKPNQNKYANDGDLDNQSLWSVIGNSAARSALPIAVGAGSLYAGFRGASGIYDHFQNKQIDEDKEKVKTDYLKALHHAGTKVGSVNTPFVDKFIEGCIDKVGGSNLLANGLRWLKEGPVGGSVSSAWDGVKDGFNSAAKGAVNSEAGSIGLGAMALLGAGAAGTTYYLANRMDENKEEARRKTNIPTEIRLNVQ